MRRIDHCTVEMTRAEAEAKDEFEQLLDSGRGVIEAASLMRDAHGDSFSDEFYSYLADNVAPGQWQAFLDGDTWMLRSDAALDALADLDDPAYITWCESEPSGICPEHGEQLANSSYTSGGSDPYAIVVLACGHHVIAMGPGDDEVYIVK